MYLWIDEIKVSQSPAFIRRGFDLIRREKNHTRKWSLLPFYAVILPRKHVGFMKTG